MAEDGIAGREAKRFNRFLNTRYGAILAGRPGSLLERASAGSAGRARFLQARARHGWARGMPGERTRVDRAALERYCAKLPDCRTFLENFFGSCGDFGYEVNRANYLLDLELYRDEPHVQRNRGELERAFTEIVPKPTGEEERQPSLSGSAGEYIVHVFGDLVLAIDADGSGTKQAVPGLKDFLLENHGRIRLGLGRTRDFDILYLFRGDGYGYAFNVDAPELSEWGYVPAGEHDAERGGE